MITIIKQPVIYQSGLTMVKSPVIYEFSGCSQTLNYNFELIYSLTGSTPDTTYVSVLRKPNVDGVIRIDCSDQLSDILYPLLVDQNSLYTDYQFLSTNSTWGSTISNLYFKGQLIETSGTTTISTTTSDVSIGTYGYITQGYGDKFDAINTIDNQTYTNTINTLLSPIETTDILEYPHFQYKDGIMYYLYSNNQDTRIKFYYTLSTGSQMLLSRQLLPTTAYNIHEVFAGFPVSALPDYSKLMRLEIWKGATELLNTYYFKFINICKDLSEYYFIQYINRFGVWDRLYFDGKFERELSSKSETYKNNNSKRTYNKRTTGSRNKFNLNTGWIQEVKNRQIQDMLLSDIVFIGKYDSNDNSVVNYTPVILSDSQFKFKSVKNDMLYFYNLTFDEALDKIK